MSRRKQTDESRRMIADAVVRLVQEHDLGSLTISQIAAEARVSRNTVYRNFRDMDEILLFVLRSYLRKGVPDTPSAEKTTARDVLLWRFRILQKSPQLRAFLTDVRRAYLMREFNEASMRFFGTPRVELQPYHLEFYVGGIDAITVQWIESGMKESPEQMVETVARLVRPDSTDGRTSGKQPGAR
jgi:AcrR family transcriptional regulator